MSNFEYIIASLPYLTRDFQYSSGEGFSQVMDQIRENLGEKDVQALDFLLKGLAGKDLTPAFYREALKHRNGFIRKFLSMDLDLRNAKVRYLNNMLGRPENQDVMLLAEDGMEEPLREWEERSQVAYALSQTDLLSREKALDDVAWESAEKLGTFHYFDLTAVLSYVTRLHIANRWLALDPEEGKERFRQLVKEVTATFKGVNYQA